MSAYGKLWQEVSEIRDALKLLVPEINTSSVDAAAEAVTGSARDLRSQAERIERLMRRWRVLEAAMAGCNDHTGDEYDTGDQHG